MKFPQADVAEDPAMCRYGCLPQAYTTRGDEKATQRPCKNDSDRPSVVASVNCMSELQHADG